jgi:prolyl oligopeptidase
MLLLLTAIGLPTMLSAQSLTYPTAHRDSTIDDYHGTRVADPYRWLEQSDSPRAAEWLKAQNKLTSDYLQGIGNRDAIQKRLTSLWAYARTDVP